MPNVYHPYEKPEIYNNKNIYMYCPPFNTTLIMHAGSGSMFRAAILGGCRAIGFEPHPQFYQLCKANIIQSVALLEERVYKYADEEEDW